MQLFLGFLLLIAYFWYLAAFSEYEKQNGKFTDVNAERDYKREKGTWTVADELHYQENAYTTLSAPVRPEHYYRVQRKV